MNLLDEAIAFFSPRAGLRRASARMTLEGLRNYDAATVGRRTANWYSPASSANVATRSALHKVRARSRDIVRNTWWGPRVVSTWTAHAVGSGIMPICKVEPKAAELWRQWGSGCDHEGQLSIDGLVALAVAEIVEAGEVLCRFVPLPRGSAPVPLELQLLEPEQLDPSRDRILFPENAGSQTLVDQGVEYDRNGKRVGYWLFPENPSAVGLMARLTSIQVPARDVLHVYRKVRIGQGRGVPWLAPVVLKGRDLADLEEAILIKSRVEACFAAFRKVTDPAAANMAQALRTETKADGTTRQIESIAPGSIQTLLPGEDIATVSPSSSLAFDSILMNTWLTLAAGCGITYDQLTGDLRQANYSSLRAGKIEFRRLLEQFQNLTLIPMFLQKVWDRFIDTAVAAGALPFRRHGYPVEWLVPANEAIDPLKDLQADILAVRSGRQTWDQFVASWGYDPDTQFEAIAAWQEKLDARKVVLDSDPRRTARDVKGAYQNDASGQPVDPTEGPGAGNDPAQN